MFRTPVEINTSSFHTTSDLSKSSPSPTPSHPPSFHHHFGFSSSTSTMHPTSPARCNKDSRDTTSSADGAPNLSQMMIHPHSTPASFCQADSCDGSSSGMNSNIALQFEGLGRAPQFKMPSSSMQLPSSFAANINMNAQANGMGVSQLFSNSRNQASIRTDSGFCDGSGTKRIGKTFLGEYFVPGPRTVVCGRGKQSQTPGNIRLKTIIRTHLTKYGQATGRAEKSSIVSRIFQQVKHGRVSESSPEEPVSSSAAPSADGEAMFVKCHKKMWWEVEDSVAREKIGCILRDELYNQSRQAKMKQAKMRLAMEQQPSESRKQQQNCTLDDRRRPRGSGRGRTQIYELNTKPQGEGEVDHKTFPLNSLAEGDDVNSTVLRRAHATSMPSLVSTTSASTKSSISSSSSLSSSLSSSSSSWLQSTTATKTRAAVQAARMTSSSSSSAQAWSLSPDFTIRDLLSSQAPNSASINGRQHHEQYDILKTLNILEEPQMQTTAPMQSHERHDLTQHQPTKTMSDARDCLPAEGSLFPSLSFDGGWQDELQQQPSCQTFDQFPDVTKGKHVLGHGNMLHTLESACQMLQSDVISRFACDFGSALSENDAIPTNTSNFDETDGDQLPDDISGIFED